MGIIGLFTLSLFVMLATHTAASKPPNFVILLMDDVGYGDITSFWNPKNQPASTPFVDYLAVNGIRFKDFHSAASNCAPSRASLLTARQGARTGLISIPLPSTQGGLPTNETTFGETFSKAGYKTGMIGKWHVGVRDYFHPNSRDIQLTTAEGSIFPRAQLAQAKCDVCGFDFYFGLPYGPQTGCTDETRLSLEGGVPCPKDWNELPGYSASDCYICTSQEEGYPALPLMNGREIIEQPLNMTDLSLRYTRAAEMFIKDREMKTPFLLYVGLQHAHVPFTVMPEFIGKSARGDPYGDVLLEMDWVIETIVKVIEEAGEAENTLIWVTSDNGPDESQCQYGGDPGPFVGQWQRTTGGGGSSSKLTVWEGGHRVPAVAYWHGTIKGGRESDELVSIMDIYPTMASLAGIEMPGDRIYDGIDISNILLDKHFPSRKRVLYHPWNQYKTEEERGKVGAVRFGDFKAVYVTGGNPECDGSSGPVTVHDPPLIFNVKKDPMESNPIDPGSPGYQYLLMEVNQALDDLEQSLKRDNTSIVDFTLNPCAMPCCNPLNVVCRCN